MSKRLIIFLHIPKTGGLTMRQVLDRQYTGNCTLRYRPHHHPRNAVRNLTPGNLAHLKCVYGHLRFGIHRHFPGRTAYITMLRDPLERILSLYYFIRSRPQNKLHRKVKKMSFKEFVTSSDPMIQALLHNHQTRMISGKKNPSLRAAKHNIKHHFVAVGITEMYPESIFVMKKALGWKHVTYSKQNVTKNRPKNSPVTEKIKEIIRENNALDYQLYASAKKRLRNQIQNLSPHEKRQLSVFKKTKRT